MKDKKFKSLSHMAAGYEVYRDGGELSKGYKPDFVLKKANNFIIMECDTGTTRKGFIGGLIKAAKFLTGNKTGILIFIIKEKKNTRIAQIHSHLIEYFHWIKPLTNLESVYLLKVEDYCIDEKPIEILGNDFITNSKCIKLIVA